MNEFYRSRAAVPRQARNGTLIERLAAWKKFRLDSVSSSCDESDDPFRKVFGEYHKTVAQLVDEALRSDDIERVKCEAKKILSLVTLAFPDSTGAMRDASGLIGAELEKILSD